MKKTAIILSVSVLLLQVLSTNVVLAQRPKAKSFFHWCQQRNSVPVATRHTIDVMLNQSGTKNCQKADAKLNTLTILDLSSNQISDVEPLASLNKLTDIDLNSNEISDVRPLASLNKLTHLNLQFIQASWQFDITYLIRAKIEIG